MLLGGPLLSAQIELIREIGRNLGGSGVSPNLPPLINAPTARLPAGQPYAPDASAPAGDTSYGSPAEADAPGQSLAGRSLLGLRPPSASTAELLRAAAAKLAQAQDRQAEATPGPSTAAQQRPGTRPGQTGAAAAGQPILPGEAGSSSRAAPGALPSADPMATSPMPGKAMPGQPVPGRVIPGQAAAGPTVSGDAGSAPIPAGGTAAAGMAHSTPASMRGMVAGLGHAPVMVPGTLDAVAADEAPDQQGAASSPSRTGVETASNAAAALASRQATARPGDPARTSAPVLTSAEAQAADARLRAPDASATTASIAGAERAPHAALVERALAGLGYAAAAGAAPPQLAAERAGVLASFILNAHFLPGWPPPRPIEQPEARQFTATLNRALLSPEELEALDYLAKLGLTAEQLRRLTKLARKARKRSKFLDAVAGFFVSLGALLSTVQEELESIADEHVAARRTEADGGRRTRIALR